MNINHTYTHTQDIKQTAQDDKILNDYLSEATFKRQHQKNESNRIDTSALVVR